MHAATGEPAHLGPAEYKAAIKTAKAAISESSGSGAEPTLVVGVSAPSLWQTVERCAYAREFGGDYVLVHAPAVYPLDEEAMARYFRKVSAPGITGHAFIHSSTFPPLLTFPFRPTLPQQLTPDRRLVKAPCHPM